MTWVEDGGVQELEVERLDAQVDPHGRAMHDEISAEEGIRAPDIKNPAWRGVGRVWWRRRESNPRPKNLHTRVYMLSAVFIFSGVLPNGQGMETTIPNDVSPRQSGLPAGLACVICLSDTQPQAIKCGQLTGF